jgi:hypothetical protein
VLAAAAAIATAMLAGMPLVWAIASICARRDAFWARYSHAALVTGYAADGGVLLTEALAHGVVQRRFSCVEGDYKHIPVRMSEEDRREVVAFARSVVQARVRRADAYRHHLAARAVLADAADIAEYFHVT